MCKGCIFYNEKKEFCNRKHLFTENKCFYYSDERVCGNCDNYNHIDDFCAVQLTYRDESYSCDKHDIRKQINDI